jgi:hypothetical protein
MNFARLALVSSLFAVILPAFAFAADTVSVQLVGERGGQMAI